MAKQEHLDILNQGVKVWNQWRKECFDIEPDLSHADLGGAILVGANLCRADLPSALQPHFLITAIKSKRFYLSSSCFEHMSRCHIS